MKKIFSIVLMTAIFMTCFSAMPAYAQDSYVMKVVADGITTYYDDFGEGWVFAVETSEETPTVVTLYQDWYAGDTNSNGVIDSDETPGYFKYYNKDGKEFGTINGALTTGTNIVSLKYRSHYATHPNKKERNVWRDTLNGEFANMKYRQRDCFLCRFVL